MSETENNSSDPLIVDVARVATPHTSVAGRLRNYFLTGLVVAGPLAITVWLIWSLITWVDGFMRPVIPPDYRPESYLPWPIPGTGLVALSAAGRGEKDEGEIAADQTKDPKPGHKQGELVKLARDQYNIGANVLGAILTKAGITEYKPELWDRCLTAISDHVAQQPQ